MNSQTHGVVGDVRVVRPVRLVRLVRLLTSPLLLATTLLLSHLSAPAADNWPRWRGPRDNGTAAPGTYPVTWSATNHILWRTPLPGKGCSTPAVWGQRIFVTAPVKGQDAALAFSDAGQLLWQKTLGSERPGKHKNASGSNPSPVTDGQGVFVYFKSGSFAGFDLDGTLRWQTNLVERFGPDTLFWDYGISPVLTEKHVIITLMHHGESWLAAFDKASGELRWRISRNYQTPTEGDNSYATPILIQHQGQPALLVWGATHLTAQSAEDGHVLWDCGGFNPEAKPYWPSVASPVVCGDFAVIPYGRGNVLHGVKLGGSGNVTATHRAWDRTDTGAYTPTPAASGGQVFLLRDEGELLCVDPATGKTLWNGAFPKSSNKFYASPVVADGKIYSAREDGVVFVTKAEGPFQLLATNTLDDRLIASPVPVNSRLLLRGEKALYCIGETAAAPASSR